MASNASADVFFDSQLEDTGYYNAEQLTSMRANVSVDESDICQCAAGENYCVSRPERETTRTLQALPVHCQLPSAPCAKGGPN